MAYRKKLLSDYLVSLSEESYSNLPDLKDKYNLDFDDSYQLKIAQEKELSIITMDKDFERVQNDINVIFI